MHTVRSALANLPFGAKIGGGFALVVALSVMLGLSGTFAIMTLNKRMTLTASATTIITQLQQVSAQREAYMKAPGEAAAAAVTAEMETLKRRLSDMRDIATLPEATARLTDAIAAVDGLLAEFNGVTANISEQDQHLASLLGVSDTLETAAKNINGAVEALRKNSSRQLAENTALLAKADSLGRLNTKQLEQALEIQTLLASSTAGPALAEAVEGAKVLAAGSSEILAAALNDEQRGELETVATQAATLAEKLQELATTTDFSALYSLKLAVKELSTGTVDLVRAQRGRTNSIVDEVRATSEALGAQQAAVGALAADAVNFINQALEARAKTFAYLGSMQGHDAQQVLTALDTLASSATALSLQAKKVGGLDGATQGLDETIASYKGVFEQIAATREALASRQDALDTGSGAVRADIAAIAETESAAAAEAGDSALFRISAMLIAAIVIGSALAVFLSRAISRPARALTATMERLADGDTDVDIAGTERGDEIGGMSRAVQVFRDNAIDRQRLSDNQEREQAAEAARQERVTELIAGFRATVQELLSSVSGSVSGMEQTAGTLSQIASQAAAQTSEAADASELANANVQTVASAAEELSSSIQEISRQVGQTTEIVNSATTGARETNAKVSSLAAAASKIGEVISLIQDIAEQTNLLALNATIEAARAGEMGKGFAVVASEVKVLATQTSKATEEIGAQVAAIQASTTDAVDAIGAITGTMDEVNQYTGAIAAAVQQQGAATGEISRSVQDATRGTTSVSENMKTLAEAVSQTSSSVTSVHSATTDVSRKTEDLRSEIDRFLREVTAA